jgi:branched-subunit amino acid permease
LILHTLAMVQYCIIIMLQYCIIIIIIIASSLHASSLSRVPRSFIQGHWKVWLILHTLAMLQYCIIIVSSLHASSVSSVPRSFIQGLWKA